VIDELAPPLKKWARKRLGIPEEGAGESEA